MSTWRLAMASVALVIGMSCTVAPAAPAGLVAGQDGEGPWWMRQTAITKDGHLALADKPWWPRAKDLAVGESFVVPESGETTQRMLVRRENVVNRAGESLEAIVWVIDDDADGSVAAGGDTDSDCYVVDYGCDGTVDRMVDYIDNDADNDPDEMDIRYFVDGQLRYTWFGIDLDDDNRMWSLRGYEYGGPSFFEADPHGDGMVYMNKLNTERGTWSPISECPFAFYDTDGDGYSEVVVRVSAVPLVYDTDVDPDYANDYNRFRATWDPSMRHQGIVNIRYGFDVDGGSSKAAPLHYEMGFNLVGKTPYDVPGMHHYNALRRPPQTTCVIPWKDLRRFSDQFRATETGFSWHEHFDDTIAIGHDEHEKNDYRWEGVFWIWERRFMENTGGPGQKWNVRREWSPRATDKRELYYSAVDKRIHLYGAEEGWIEHGHFAGMNRLGETRMLDTDHNGYFDRWEVYGDGPVPVRVTTVRDERVQPVPSDENALREFYTRDILPSAMAANERFMAAMARIKPFEPEAGLSAAMATGSPNFRRYAQDVTREMQYQDLRQSLTSKAHAVLAAAKMDDLRPLPQRDRQTTWNSHTAWLLIRAVERLDVAYGAGDLDGAEDVLQDIAGILKAAGG